MFGTVYGVDFSGAKLAGRNTWVARLERGGGRWPRPAYRLAALACLERLSGTAERAGALAHLAGLIRASDGALWALDFPFGLPVEVMGAGCRWPGQLAFLRAWGEDAYAVGEECLRRAKALGGPNHIRRLTDDEARATFDCYHYRIIYQTFFGMRDVLAPLAASRGAAVLPFQYRRLPTARRVLVESCPGSLLKKLGLPHQNYKQPAGGPLTHKRLKTRHRLMDWLAAEVAFDARQRRVMMRNGGGDALDAVIAGVGAAVGWREADHVAIRRHPRYPREGRMFV
jgi:hypothetical protein